MPQPSIAQQELSKVYDRINSVESKVDETNGYLKGVVESNEKLIALLQKRDASLGRMVYSLMGLLLFAICVIAYGAVGDKGMKSIRETMPRVPTAAIPPHNDFDKWMYHSNHNPQHKA